MPPGFGLRSALCPLQHAGNAARGGPAHSLCLAMQTRTMKPRRAAILSKFEAEVKALTDQL